MDFRAEIVKRFFNTLPDTPEGIRDLLVTLGIKGNRKASSCPIANLIRMHTLVNVRVLRGSTYESTDCDVIWNVTNPKPVYDFVENFDNHMYPELEEND